MPTGRGFLLIAALAIARPAALDAQAASRSPLEIAKARDAEISELKSRQGLSEAAKTSAILDLASRIRRQPKEFRVALAANLATDAVDETSDDGLLDIVNTLAGALRDAPRKAGDSAYRTLAALIRYAELPTTLDDPNYASALEDLEREEKHRSGLDFTLSDLRGQVTRLKQFEGKVVLVNFWATWCPPCRLEVPHLIELHRRFAGQGLEILAISDEEPAPVLHFVTGNKVSYRVLLDPGGTVRDRFRVSGLPQTFLYDRKGKLVAHAPASPTMPRLLRMLERAGLR